jgi:hypothetical protein
MKTIWIEFLTLGTDFFDKALEYMEESILLMRAQRESIETKSKLSIHTQRLLLVLGQNTDKDIEYLSKYEMNAVRRWRKEHCPDQDKCTDQELIDTIRDTIKDFKKPSSPI